MPDRHILTVLGGSSTATPILLEALGRSVAAGRLPALHVRLYGRAADRMARVAEHGLWRIARVAGGADVTVSAHTALGEALPDAAFVIGQVRPGGMAGRSRDEALAQREGIPGDEGLGPSGLSCFLRGRAVMDELAGAVAAHAPGATYLQLTSPLGLTVARARGRFGVDCVGVCELPTTTAQKVRAHVEPKLGCGPLSVQHAGLNHQAWLHVFSDSAGRDRTDDVLAALDDPKLVDVDPAIIREQGAVPVNYLRLYFHAARELDRQLSRGGTRGEELDDWTGRAEGSYLAEGGVDHAGVDAVLSERRMNWYEDGVVPALEAFFGDEPTVIPLNLPGGGALAGADPAAVVELPCAVSREGVVPQLVPSLPPGPAALTERLLAYEAAVLALSDAPSADDVAAVLAVHPMVPDEATAARLAASILG